MKIHGICESSKRSPSSKKHSPVPPLVTGLERKKHTGHTEERQPHLRLLTLNQEKNILKRTDREEGCNRGDHRRHKIGHMVPQQ